MGLSRTGSTREAVGGGTIVEAAIFQDHNETNLSLIMSKMSKIHFYKENFH